MSEWTSLDSGAPSSGDRADCLKGSCSRQESESLVILIAPLSRRRARSFAGSRRPLQVAPQHLTLAQVPGPNHPAVIPVDAALSRKES
jgi:hypothetical protein